LSTSKLTADRFSLPQAETLVTKVASAGLDLEMATTAEETRSLEQLKESNTWRTLRIATSSNLSKFDKLEGHRNLGTWLQDSGAEHGPAPGNEEVQDGEGVDGEGTNAANNEATNDGVPSSTPKAQEANPPPVVAAETS
jgi:hypothetical protein